MGKIARKGKRADLEKARAIYDYVTRTMRYDKSGEGWDRGDALWACDAKWGNCTDFHLVLMGMARRRHPCLPRPRRTSPQPSVTAGASRL